MSVHQYISFQFEARKTQTTVFECRTSLLSALPSITCFTFSFLYQSWLHRPVKMTACPNGGEAEVVTPTMQHVLNTHGWKPGSLLEQLFLCLKPRSPPCPLISPSFMYMSINTHDICVCAFHLRFLIQFIKRLKEI